MATPRLPFVSVRLVPVLAREGGSGSGSGSLAAPLCSRRGSRLDVRARGPLASARGASFLSLATGAKPRAEADRELRAHHNKMERQDGVGYPTEPREFIEFVLARTHHTCNSLTSAWPNVATCDLLRFLDRSKHTRRGSSTLDRITARVDEFRTLLLAAYPHPSALPQLVAPERPVQVRDRPRHSFFCLRAQAPFGRQLTMAANSHCHPLTAPYGCNPLHALVPIQTTPRSA